MRTTRMLIGTAITAAASTTGAGTALAAPPGGFSPGQDNRFENFFRVIEKQNANGQTGAATGA